MMDTVIQGNVFEQMLRKGRAWRRACPFPFLFCAVCMAGSGSAAVRNAGDEEDTKKSY